MVLLNGVKYACERCIRGHRVSSCTHTDKPLTMIKPKGRPASQCLHCRELRKQRNTHTSCLCGKKGKSPGQHFASCLCHKNSLCTCIKEKKRKKKPDEEEAEGPQMLIEDIAIPFEAEFGLLDCFSPSLFSAPELPKEKTGQAFQKEMEGFSEMDRNLYLPTLLETPQSLPAGHDPEQALLPNFANPPSDAELDFMENMFPLFPLVGSSSFSDSSSIPLLAIAKKKPEKELPKVHTPQSIGTPQSQNQNQQSHGQNLQNAQNQNQNANSQSYVPNPLLGRSASQSTNFNPYSMGTHHPKPLRASASFDGPAYHNGSSHNLQNVRPRRPESVLSVTSLSSNTSKQNLLEFATYNLPKTLSSAAFPPFHSSENNSHDDIASTINPGGMFHESRLLSLVSDDEFKTSSLPSRQPLQTRRKLSLTRTHHIPHMKEKANSAETSPYQTITRRSPSVDQLKLSRIDTYLREVAEESAPASIDALHGEKHPFGGLASLEQSRDLAFDLPMYSELLEYSPH